MPRNIDPTGFDDIDGLTSELTDGLSGAFARILGDCGPHVEKHAGRRGHDASKSNENDTGRQRDRAHHTSHVRHPRDN